jgi:uncharacterized short protein YbdD (DUF466 family)
MRNPFEPAALRSLAGLWRRVARTTGQICGVPDYDAYVAHCRRHHPDRPVMSYEEFFRNRLDARYGGGSGGGMRCC